MTTFQCVAPNNISAIGSTLDLVKLKMSFYFLAYFCANSTTVSQLFRYCNVLLTNTTYRNGNLGKTMCIIDSFEIFIE